jgi:hypothetical protein
MQYSKQLIQKSTHTGSLTSFSERPTPEGLDQTPGYAEQIWEAEQLSAQSRNEHSMKIKKSSDN